MVITPSSSPSFHCCCWCGGRAVQSWHTTLRAPRTARRGFSGKTLESNSYFIFIFFFDKWFNYFSLGCWRLVFLFAASDQQTVVEFYFSLFALTSPLDSCALASLVSLPRVLSRGSLLEDLWLAHSCDTNPITCTYLFWFWLTMKREILCCQTCCDY